MYPRAIVPQIRGSLTNMFRHVCTAFRRRRRSLYLRSAKTARTAFRNSIDWFSTIADIFIADGQYQFFGPNKEALNVIWFPQLTSFFAAAERMLRKGPDTNRRTVEASSLRNAVDYDSLLPSIVQNAHRTIYLQGKHSSHRIYFTTETYRRRRSHILSTNIRNPTIVAVPTTSGRRNYFEPVHSS